MLRPLIPNRVLQWRRVICAVRTHYRIGHGRDLQLFQPRRFNDKMQWRKLFELDPRMALYCDKIATRDHVIRELGRDHATPVLWSGSDPDAMPLETLPTPFVVKSTHSSGDVVLVRDRADLDPAALRAQARNWLATCHGLRMNEPGYVNVPHRLVVEALLHGHGGAPPIEYNVMCFGGVPKWILCVIAPEDPEDRRRSYYSTDWQPLPFRQATYRTADGVLPRPATLDVMLETAARLAAGMPHLRVDMYDTAGGIVVGELTPYHTSGMRAFVPDEVDFTFGAAWPLRFPLLRALWTMARREHAIPAWKQD